MTYLFNIYNINPKKVKSKPLVSSISGSLSWTVQTHESAPLRTYEDRSNGPN